MGDASQVSLFVAPEATFGTNPGTGFQQLRFNNEGLKHAQGTLESGEINPTRQPPGSLRISRSAEGPITCEDSLITPAATPTGFDMLIKAAMMSAWSTIIALTGKALTISGASGGTFTVTDAGTTAAFTNAVKGQWLKLGLLATNGTVYAHITAKTSNDIIVCEGVRSSGVAVTNEVATGCTVGGSMIRIGNTRNSLSIEKKYGDLTVIEYSLLLGGLVSQWSLGIGAQQAMQHNWTILGQLYATLAGSSGAGSPAAIWSTPHVTAAFDYYMKMEGVFTALSAHRIAEINFSLDNRPRLDFEVGSITPQVGIGTPRLTGSYNVFMDDAALERKLEAGTASKLCYRQNDGTRDRIITFQNIKYTDGGATAGGNDQAVTQTLNWSAEPDADGVSFQIDRMG